MVFSRGFSVLLAVLILGLHGTVLAQTDDDSTTAGEGQALKDRLHYLLSVHFTFFVSYFEPINNRLFNVFRTSLIPILFDNGISILSYYIKAMIKRIGS